MVDADARPERWAAFLWCKEFFDCHLHPARVAAGDAINDLRSYRAVHKPSSSVSQHMVGKIDDRPVEAFGRSRLLGSQWISRCDCVEIEHYSELTIAGLRCVDQQLCEVVAQRRHVVQIRHGVHDLDSRQSRKTDVHVAKERAIGCLHRMQLLEWFLHPLLDTRRPTLCNFAVQNALCV